MGRNDAAIMTFNSTQTVVKTSLLGFFKYIFLTGAGLN